MNPKADKPKTSRKHFTPETKHTNRERKQEKKSADVASAKKPGRTGRPLKLRSLQRKKDTNPPTDSQPKISLTEKKAVLPRIPVKQEETVGGDIPQAKRYEKGMIKNVLIDDAQYAQFSRTKMHDILSLSEHNLTAQHETPEAKAILIPECSISKENIGKVRIGGSVSAPIQLYGEGEIEAETRGKLEHVLKKNRLLKARRASIAAIHFAFQTRIERQAKLEDNVKMSTTKKVPPINRTKSMGSYRNYNKTKMSREASIMSYYKFSRKVSENSSEGSESQSSLTGMEASNNDTSMFKLRKLRRAPVGKVSQVIGDLSFKLTKVAGKNISRSTCDLDYLTASQIESLTTRIRSLSVGCKENCKTTVLKRRAKSCNAEMLIESIEPDISEYLNPREIGGTKLRRGHWSRVTFKKAVIAVRCNNIAAKVWKV